MGKEDFSSLNSGIIRKLREKTVTSATLEAEAEG